jgi:uncharacterized membrane protein YdjX (TVP38/TMEM64 family)
MGVLVTNHSKHIVHELHVYLHDQAHWKTIARWLVIGGVAFFLIVWFGKDVIDEIEIVEAWIEGHGALGWAAFVGLIVVVTSVFLPLSMMAIAGGAMFGLVGGTVLTFTGAVLTAGLNYLGARSLLKTRIESMLEHHPKLRAIQLAVHRQGLRLQLLLRMAPINATSVNYVLGATGIRFPIYLIATVGLIPSIIVNVYFGYAASHVTKVAGKASENSTLHTVATVVGLIVCIAVMIAITKVATKAIAEAEAKTD